MVVVIILRILPSKALDFPMNCRRGMVKPALGRLPTVQAAVHEASLAEIVLEMTLRGIAHLYRYGTAYGLLQRLAVLPQLLFELFGCHSLKFALIAF